MLAVVTYVVLCVATALLAFHALMEESGGAAIVPAVFSIFFGYQVKVQSSKNSSRKLLTRGARSLGAGHTRLGLIEIRDAHRQLQNYGSPADVGVANLYLACALALSGEHFDAREQLRIANQLLATPEEGAYASLPDERHRLQALAETLSGYLAGRQDEGTALRRLLSAA